MNIEKSFFGRTGYPGYALAQARLFQEEIFHIPQDLISDIATELNKWRSAQAKSKKQLEELLNSENLQEAREIIEAHLMMIEDPEWMSGIEGRIEQRFNALKSVSDTSAEFKAVLEGLDDSYMRARAQDIQDLCRRVLKNLSNPSDHEKTESSIAAPFVLIAKEILPSQFLALERHLLKALVVENASQTSHTAILAKTFEIPMIVASPPLQHELKNGDWVAINALKAEIVISPDQNTKLRFETALKQQEHERHQQLKWVKQKSISTDGVSFEVASNLSSLVDAEIAVEKGTEGCGLFRSEFMLMEKTHWPTEQEQFEIYKKLVEKMNPHRTVLRLFDIGGDKNLPYFSLPKEENPFLGLRGFRLLLKHRHLLDDQIRAALRAAQFGRLSLMAPMITTAEEVYLFKSAILKCQESLLKSGQLNPNTVIEIGIMVEVPAIVMALKDIIHDLDFVSVGTNDLIQYLCATDRMNSEVSHLHDAYNPSILRFLNFMSEQVKPALESKKLWLGMCGELAGLEPYIPLLMSLGFKELSVSPGALLKTRQVVCETSVKDSHLKLQKALLARSSEELKTLLTTPQTK